MRTSGSRLSSSTVFCWANASKSIGSARLGRRAILLVPQGAGDLLRQLVVQAVDQVADVVLDVADVQVLPPPVTGIKDVEQVAEDLDDGLAAGQRLVAEVAGAAALGIGGDDGLGDLRQRFLQSDVGGHRNAHWLGTAYALCFAATRSATRSRRGETKSHRPGCNPRFMLGGWRGEVNLLLFILRTQDRQNAENSNDPTNRIRSADRRCRAGPSPRERAGNAWRLGDPPKSASAPAIRPAEALGRKLACKKH